MEQVECVCQVVEEMLDEKGRQKRGRWESWLREQIKKESERASANNNSGVEFISKTKRAERKFSKEERRFGASGTPFGEFPKKKKRRNEIKQREEENYGKMPSFLQFELFNPITDFSSFAILLVPQFSPSSVYYSIFIYSTSFCYSYLFWKL